MNNTITDFLTSLSNYRNNNANNFNLKDFVNWGTYGIMSQKHPGANPKNNIRYVLNNTFSREIIIF